MRFLLTLAATLGRTVGEILEMPSPEFSLWREFYRQGGIGPERRDWSIAVGAAAVAQSMGAKVTARDLIPKFGREEEDRAELLRWMREIGGKEA